MKIVHAGDTTHGLSLFHAGDLTHGLSLFHAGELQPKHEVLHIRNAFYWEVALIRMLHKVGSNEVCLVCMEFDGCNST